MANRFWVGGTANWDGTAGTKWAASSGGAGGETVPTSADDVFFDGASGAVTCTLASGNTGSKALNFTGFTGTFTGSLNFQIFGSLTINSGMTYTHTGTMNFNATATITTAGKTLGPVTIGGSGITVDLADALTSSGAITLTQGTFTTNDYAVTAASLSSSNSNTRAINLGSSTVTLSGANAITFTTASNLTFNAGTSSIVLTGTTSRIFGNTIPGIAITFYNVSFTSTALTNGFIDGINNSNIFNNLQVSGTAVAGVSIFIINAGFVVNGTLSTTGTAGNRRVWIRSGTYGIAHTLTINSAPSLTDADFRDIYVIGTAAPISGTRVGDLRGCRGITFDAPKTVYWVTAAGGSWSGNNWAASSGGGASTDNFPLAQDTAVIENTGLNTSATVTFDTPIQSIISGIDMSARTSSMTLSTNAGTNIIYGDWENGAGVTISGTSILQFSGRNTQTITSAGKTFSAAITVDSYGGTVELADALNIGSNTLTVTNGTFDTKNYNVTAGALSSANINVRTITLGSSTVTLSGTAPLAFGVVNFTFDCGTSSIVCTSAGVSFTGAFQTFYDVSFTGGAGVKQLNNEATYRNLFVSAPASAAITTLVSSANQTINGTLTVAGATAVRRIFLRSDTLGTTRTLTVNSLSADDCDFRDITIAGTAAGSSPTRAGDCGGNTGITFPAPKTVYWNLGGTVDWSSTGWAASSGGSPAVNNFPLAQDTAVFDEAGTASIVRFNAAWNVGTVNASARTTAVQLSTSLGGPFVYGSWSFGTGVTSTSATPAITFAGRSTQTITSNGVTFGCPITIDCFTSTVQLADALTLGSTRTLTLTSGTFDAVTYNVTTGLFNNTSATTATVLKMGSGTWTLSGTGTVWNTNTLTFNKGTANIVLSNTSTSARAFSAGTASYNKLTIGGTTGTSTTTINGNGAQFTELASTKTVAHTIALPDGLPITFGAWTVSGTAGNVVTVNSTSTITIAGARVSGVDYLAMGTNTVSATSPGEFYSGANSTGTGANIIKTAAPTPVTRYWVGGTGTWDATTTTKWSDTSGGSGGFSVPTSADAVIFNSLSNATAYTVTCTATQLRCGSLTMAGPLVGNVTWAGSAPIAMHDNVTLAATGITRSYTGVITLSGSATGKTFTTNGVALASTVTVNGVGCGWTLGSAFNNGAVNQIVFTNGSFDTGNFNLTSLAFSSSNSNDRTIILGSSTVTLSGSNPIAFGIDTNLAFNAGTSSVVLTNTGSLVNTGAGVTFYDVSFTSTSATLHRIVGANIFNNLSVTGRTSAGLCDFQLSANQTINGTLTLSAGGDGTCRTFVQSNTIGTTRTLTCAVFSGTDADFRDITIAGAAAPVSGTRLGDCKGNSGITFGAAKTVYWNSPFANQSWSSGYFALSIGGGTSADNFPLAQDTFVVPSSSPTSGGSVTINAAYNIGTIDMSARTSNTMTLASSVQPSIYGDVVTGTGVTYSGTGRMIFAGRTTQQFTSAGRTYVGAITVDSPSGSLVLQDALIMSTSSSSVLTLNQGTFDANGYNVTLSGTSSAFSNSGTLVRTAAIGSGTWTLAGSATAWSSPVSTNLTVTGTGTISLTSASAKTFAGGGISYSGITLDQGGAGTLTISGNNTFANITNSYSATGATTIAMGTTTQTVGSFTASGEAGRVLTVQGTSASSPATLVFSGSGQATAPTTDYLTITGVRAYSLDTTWYAGANSTNNGSLGWYFEAGGGGPISVFIIESATSADAQSSLATLNISMSESTTAADAQAAGFICLGTLSESATVADAVEAFRAFLASVAESATSSELVSAALTLSAAISELTTGADATAVTSRVTNPTIAEAAQMADSLSGGLLFLSNISEATTAQEIAASVLIFNRAVSEATTASEVLAAVAAFNAAVPESVSGSEVANALVSVGGSINEALTALDAAVGPKTTRPTISEAVAASESTANVYTANPVIAETASPLDTAQVVASTFSAASAETAIPLDTPQGANTGSSSLSESATVSEAQATQFTAATAISEASTVQESQVAVFVAATQVAEAAAIADTTSVAPSTFGAIALAAAQAAESFSPAGSVYNAALPVESAGITDFLVGAYLWNPIDDNQTPNWQNVNNAQGSGWVLINTDDAPNWQPTIQP